MIAKQLEVLVKQVLPTSTVSLLVIGGIEYTGTNVVIDKTNNLVTLTRTNDNVRMTFDGQAVFGFTLVPPPPSA